MCIFCKIVAKEIPSKVAFEDDRVLAFHDITPVAPKHVLVIPKRHVESLSDAAVDPELLGHVMAVAARVAEQEGIAQSGYRVVLNTGPHAGQSVFHLHAHVLGGRAMAWPPG